MLIPNTAAPLTIDVLVSDRPVVEGGSVGVRLRATAEQDLTAVAGRIDLVREDNFQYHLAGMFNARARNRHVAASVALPPWGRMLAAERLDVADVELPVPAGSPGSAQGAIINVAWRVEVHVTCEDAPPTTASTALEVLSRALDQGVAAGRPPTAGDAGCAVLSLDRLSTRDLRPGSLDGSVTVMPRIEWVARAAHVALIRSEHVDHGIWMHEDPARNPPYQEKDVDVKVARQRLADRIHLMPGQPVRLAFALPVARSVLVPSIRTDEFTISWSLRAWLERPLRRSPFIEVPLHVATAP